MVFAFFLHPDFLGSIFQLHSFCIFSPIYLFYYFPERGSSPTTQFWSYCRELPSIKLGNICSDGFLNQFHTVLIGCVISCFSGDRRKSSEIRGPKNMGSQQSRCTVSTEIDQKIVQLPSSANEVLTVELSQIFVVSGLSLTGESENSHCGLFRVSSRS